MRIVLVNWTRLADGASLGGGVSGYTQQLALELARRGHEVCYLSSGVAYTPALAPCSVRRHADHAGIRVFEVVNSPVVAPGPCQAKNPGVEVASPVLEAELTRFFRLLEPDIVHFHNIEGFSAGCLSAARKGEGGWPGAKVLFSLHNYHTVCPQVYLMQSGTRPCHSFDNGHACVGCFGECDPGAERTHRAKLYALGFPPPPPPPPPPLPVGDRIRQVFSRPTRAVVPPLPLPGRPIETFADLAPDRVKPMPRSAPTTAPDRPSADDPLWTPLSNEVRPEPPSDKPPNEYAARRAAMVQALSACDRVLAVSAFVKAKFESFGVDPRVLDTVPIGSRMAELAGATPAQHRTLPVEPNRPIRLAFVGYHNFYKGLHMLTDALELLPTDVLGRFDLLVNAKAVEEFEPRLRRLQPRLARLTVQYGYQYDRIPEILAGTDLGLVPSVWWDNGPQTVMEFFACGIPVLGAALGGIPDLVGHGVNGMLHRGNDRHDLAKRLTEIADDPGMLTRLRSGVRPPRSMKDHAATIEGIYARTLAVK